MDFSDLKKKKKKKKANLDMEAFEKELKSSSAADPDADEDADPTPAVDLDDDADLGDDPFANPSGDVPTSVGIGNEAWLKSDRDYLYPEVRMRRIDTF